MGIWKDVVETVKDLKLDKMGAQIISGGSNKTSLSRMASDGILQFPVITSRAIESETMQMVSKALERNYASYAQTAFSMYSTMNIKDVQNPAAFVKLFHQNNDETGKMAASAIHNRIDNITASNMAEAYTVYEDESGSIMMSAVYEDVTTGNIINLNRDQLFRVLEHLEPSILNDKFIPKQKSTIYNFSDPALSQKYNTVHSLREADGDRPRENRPRAINTDLSNNMLSDNDAKKANELVPTMLHIRVNTIADDGSSAGIIDFNIGIKAVLHPVKSSDMVTNLVAVCNNKDKLFNFFRWTTGEISFFKDFVLDINEIKTDVANKGAGSSLWWSALKRRSRSSKIRKIIPGANTLLPNATFVISQDEADYIKDSYGYDLEHSYFVDKLMENYFLLGFVIVDAASQLVKFHFDGEADFQTVTYSGLEKENSTAERKFKEMLKVINRN